jgi:hypothetical protein
MLGLVLNWERGWRGMEEEALCVDSSRKWARCQIALWWVMSSWNTDWRAVPLKGRMNRFLSSISIPLRWERKGCGREEFVSGNHKSGMEGETPQTSGPLFSVKCVSVVMNQIFICVWQREEFIPASRSRVCVCVCVCVCGGVYRVAPWERQTHAADNLRLCNLRQPGGWGAWRM